MPFHPYLCQIFHPYIEIAVAISDIVHYCGYFIPVVSVDRAIAITEPTSIAMCYSAMYILMTRSYEADVGAKVFYSL